MPPAPLRGLGDEGTHTVPIAPNRPSAWARPGAPHATLTAMTLTGMPTTTAPRRLRRMAAPGAALAGVAATWLVVAAADPGDGGPTLCPWRAVTGLDCPFCGATRAAAALGRGDVVAALDHNALLVVVIVPLAIGAWILWARRAWRAGPAVTVTNKAVGILMAVTLAWWALRLAVPWLDSVAS